jgi:regulator of RNase E activity RraA
MITVSTELDIHNQGTEHVVGKYVTMRMEADDAFALATILMNQDDDVLIISAEWVQTCRRLAHKLIDAGNVCR